MKDGTFLDQSPVCPYCDTQVTWTYMILGRYKLIGRDADGRDHYPVCPVLAEKSLEDLNAHPVQNVILGEPASYQLPVDFKTIAEIRNILRKRLSEVAVPERFPKNKGENQ